MRRRKPVRRAVGCLILLVLLVIAARLALDYARDHPERLPWTALDLTDPIGPFTGRKLAALTGEPDQCRALLAAAGSANVAVTPHIQDTQCGYDDGVRLVPSADHSIRFTPAGVVASCPVAAALLLFEREIVQPAALRRFGQRVASIDHAGSYSCRRINGGAVGPFSEHATADAIDITGFRLGEGQRIGILRDWGGSSPEAMFLRDVRDGACKLFATVLSPDYNAAHSDHFHLDQAERSPTGWRGCR